ncbi:MAG: hypothetical protein SGJ27_06570 [Candidatus Melainabacteria bacterium]|nr:hypothetical protein [Candidatus Melainabacteria bacterium]
MDDLDNTSLENEGESPFEARLADEWCVGGGSKLVNRRLGQQADLLEGIDVTADFPTSPNPFNETTNAALADIAKATSTPVTTLTWLADNPNPDVRKATAGNTSTPAATLRKLSKDWDGSVRLAVLDNPKVPIDIITELSNDSNPLVSLRACYALDERRRNVDGSGGRPSAPSPTIKDIPNLHAYNRYMQAASSKALSSQITPEAIEFLKIVAERVSTPPERLAELSNHPSPEVRASVARNGSAPLPILWRLSLDLDPLVKSGLTQNQSCPVELLRELLRDGDVAVRRQAQHEINRMESGNR